MSIRIGAVVINCADIELLTQFWCQALHLTAGPLTEGGRFRVLGGDRVFLSLQVAQAPVSARDQMHLDLYTDDQAVEVARLIGLGARHVRDNHDPEDDYVVLADPEGNRFCVCATASTVAAR
ncbi:MAG TPA: VOC family protein [Candidatus Limnocylindrales bacterium]|nr:VOC family protein [Candidatus Limnocylindrales bacterium]